MSGYEWLIVAGVVLLLFGGSQIPKLARSLGQASKEFKQGQSDSSKGGADSEKLATGGDANDSAEKPKS